MLSHLKPPIDDYIERLSKWSSLILSAELVVAANEDEEHTGARPTATG